MLKCLRALLVALALAAPARADEFSANPVTIATLTGAGQTLLATTGPIVGRGKWFVMNQSAGRIWIVLDDGKNAVTDATDPTRTVFIVDPGSAANAMGGWMGWQDTGEFFGRIRIYGPAGSQVGLFRQ